MANEIISGPISIKGTIVSCAILEERTHLEFNLSFSEEYFQAGVNLLSYFSSYLKKNYPNESAKVAIKQDGMKVVLTVESNDGTIDRIEELLSDYIGGVTGKTPLDSITTNDIALIDLRQQVREAEMKIEFQRDMLEYKGAEIGRLHSVLQEAVSTQLAVNVSPKNVLQIGIRVGLGDSQLQSELRQIQRYLEDRGDDVSSNVAQTLKKATDAAESGDESSAKEYLRTLGKYVVDTATKVGVPVAQAYLKDLLEL